MKKIVRLTSIFIIIFLLCGLAIAFSGCKKEPAIPWYEDYENVELVLEDERTEEKTMVLKYRSDCSEKITFTYKINESNKDDTEEYIPNLKLMYKGVEQKVFLHFYKKYKFLFDGTEYDYKNPVPVGGIRRLGYYYVSIEYYLHEEDLEHFDNKIWDEEIYINVIWED